MNRSALAVMRKLIGLVSPLLHVMVVAIVFGVIGNLCAIFMVVFASMSIMDVLGYQQFMSSSYLIIAMFVCALLRGILRYIEQASNHYIAFKLLALIRHKVFVKLRELAPAKVEGKDKGNLISLITSDIELLEVFYAHTISPIAIAFITSLIMMLFIGYQHYLFGIIALIGYSIIGILVPVFFERKGQSVGREYRDEYGQLNGFVLDSLRGIKESVQYHHEYQRLQEMDQKTIELEEKQGMLKKIEAQNAALTDALIFILHLLMFVIGIYLYVNHQIDLNQFVLAQIAYMSSFGPVIALSHLSNNLHHTLACGNRVLNLLEEKPIVHSISHQKEMMNGDLLVDDVTFAYDDEVILSHVDALFKRKHIVGVQGKSGSGKSTLLKLMMRFWEPQSGQISIAGRSLDTINTDDLRQRQAYVTQSTYLFNDTFFHNIAIAKPEATYDEVVKAAKKASIHDFIMSLPQQYDTVVGELGGKLSGGQIQRIGIARAFLHDADIILLDEPTSNLDTLNEASILKTMKETFQDKTVIIVSHRPSTMSIVDELYHMESSRIS